ncbi:MAG: hypothetical protein ACTTHG_02980 [Treponemataceae bacterium]
MLFSVYEASYILNISPTRLYYELSLSRVKGAFKVLSNWRIDEDTLKEMYERFRELDFGESSCNFGYSGFEERLESVRQKCMENIGRSTFTRLQSRRRMECNKGRFDKLVENKKRNIIYKQLLLFNEEDF